MSKYIKADLYRIFRRIPRYMLLALVMIVVVAVFWPGSNDDSTIIQLVDLLETFLKYSPIYLGFIEIIYIFGDDFAGKTAQIAIGIGVKRSQIIFAKWLETMIVVGADIAMIVVVSLGLSVFKTHTLPIELLADIFAHMAVSVVATAAFVALVFPIMFLMQSITIAFLLYMLFCSGAINKIIGYLANMKYLRMLNINNLTLSNCLNVFRSRMILGSFHVQSVMGIVIYVVVTLWITIFIYKKRELEF